MSGKPEGKFRLDVSSDEIMNGTGSDDRLQGTNGDDHIFGEAGNDCVNGRQGDDVLAGGGGRDILWGGPGSDSFVFVRGESHWDLVRDFRDGDTLVLQGYGDATFEDLTIENQGNRVVVSLEGDTIARVATNEPTLDAGDFVFMDDAIA